MTMTAAETLKNRLATIHKDMCDLSHAIGGAARDVENGRATIAATIERRLTDDLEERAFRLERMVKAENIGMAVYQAAMSIASAFLHQRHNCKRNRAQFIAHGATMTALTESGVFQQLIAKRKAAKAAVEAEQGLIDVVDANEPAPTAEPLVDVVVYFKGTMKDEVCTPYNMKHVTKTASVETAIAEAHSEFNLVSVSMVYLNNREVSAQYVTHTVAETIKEEEAKAIPANLNTKAMMEADAMKAVEGFGLNPKTVVETMTRVAGAMRRDGLTQDQITADVLAAYMEADRKTQEKMFMDYMTNPETRKKAQAAILDVLEQQEMQKAAEVAALKRQLAETHNRFINEWVIWSDKDNNAILIGRDQTPAQCSPLTAPEQSLCGGKEFAEMMGCRLVRRHRAIKMRLTHLEK